MLSSDELRVSGFFSCLEKEFGGKGICNAGGEWDTANKLLR